MQAVSRLIAVAAIGLALTTAAHAVSGGDLDVLPKGNYVCELPGDAGDPGIAGGRHQPDSDFAVFGDSTYRSQGMRGVYLMTGANVVMTSGPLRGRRFTHIKQRFLRETNADGSPGALRCISSIQAIGIEPADGRRCKARKPQDTMDKVARAGGGAASC